MLKPSGRIMNEAEFGQCVGIRGGREGGREGRKEGRMEGPGLMRQKRRHVLGATTLPLTTRKCGKENKMSVSLYKWLLSTYCGTGVAFCYETLPGEATAFGVSPSS